MDKGLHSRQLTGMKNVSLFDELHIWRDRTVHPVKQLVQSPRDATRLAEVDKSLRQLLPQLGTNVRARRH